MQGGKPLLDYSVDDLHNVLLILALDKLLYISLVPSNGIGAISTSGESIGELERP